MDEFDALMVNPLPFRPRYVARCSYGNDSIAMLQLMKEHGLEDVVVTYSDTGWASEEWEERVLQGEAWVRSLGWSPVRLSSVGFEQNVYNQTKTGMWPTRLAKHCTKYLKIIPFLNWIKDADPDKRALICVGVRRAESKDRAHHPAFMPQNDDGRHVWHPLIEFSDEDRNAMIRKTPFPVLEHRSDECEICININRQDMRRASDRAIDRIEVMEARVGRPMFNPDRFMGACGIRQVKAWADAEPGKFVATTEPPKHLAEYEANRRAEKAARKVARPVDLEEVADAEPATCEDGWCGA